MRVLLSLDFYHVNFKVGHDVFPFWEPGFVCSWSYISNIFLNIVFLSYFNNTNLM